jgi:hypothetical protein
MDGCARGPASLACFGGGTPGECIREVDPGRQHMQVTCAAPSPDATTTATTTVIHFTPELPASDTGYTGHDNGTSWEYFEGYNCYPPFGADDIPGKSPIPHANLQDCRAACEEEPSCEGIVQVRSLPEGPCWLRQGVTLDNCLTSTTYDFWLLEKSGQL